MRLSLSLRGCSPEGGVVSSGDTEGACYSLWIYELKECVLVEVLATKRCHRCVFSKICRWSEIILST